MNLTPRLLFLPCLLFLASIANAGLELPSVFSDHLVLQRDANVPVWGTTEAGSKITVAFADQKATATANDSGAWRVELKPLAASAEGRSLLIESSSGDKREIQNVLVGDVWVGSGQSNMAGRVASYAKNDETLAKLLEQAPFSNIRLMQGGPKPTWTLANQDTVSRFSALHFAFGERLQREVKVPVGLIVGAVGGTPSGSWIPPKTYASSEKCQAAVAEFAKTWDQAAETKKYEARLQAWEKQAAAAKAKGQKPRGRKPQPPRAPGESSRGRKIGGLYERFIQSVVGYRIRGVLWDQGEARSGVVGVDQHTMMSELIRGWRGEWKQGDFPFLFVQKPSGGGCAFSNQDPITRNGDPFSAQPAQVPAATVATLQRYVYVRLMRDTDNGWMVPASDLGSGIHPPNKWGYGNRAAEVALSKVYKTDVQAYGPTYRSHSVQGGQVVIEFDHVGQGLVAAHQSELQGFAIAGADGDWRWAEAKIDGDTVVLSSADVPKPSRVRYAFSQNRRWANLFNKDGLPALCFEAGE